MLKKTAVIVFLFLALTGMPVSAAPEAMTATDIANELVCQCGCNMILNNCTHEECHSREEMTAFIVREMARGQTGPQIIQTFVRQYGDLVLASPPKQGFNLVAWILPFAAIIAGGAVIYFALKEWVGRGRQSPEPVKNSTDNYDEYRIRLEKELKEFEGSGFR